MENSDLVFCVELPKSIGVTSLILLCTYYLMYTGCGYSKELRTKVNSSIASGFKDR